ncbi:MAG: Ldh family oxidoreductase [Pseudomonadota bacterium]|nr:Ldh family oxidoreductase [Pseudomonadota bacterium]
MTEAELQGLAARAFVGLGLGGEDAADAARILVLGELFGHATHGVLRLESYGQRIDAGAIRADAKPRLEDAAPAIVKVDGNGAVGPVVGMRALRATMGRARETGVGVALVRNGNHFGAIAPYCYLAALQGFATLIASNASTTIAPTGGREERLGNNPLGIGVPRPGSDPIILDMAMSVVARGKIRAAAKNGAAIPATWATDRAGKPTTDPAAALEGFLLPFGGYKGYGLALMVDLLAGVLSGAGYLTHVKSWLDQPAEPGNLGHFFLAIDTRVLGSTEWLTARVADFAAIVHDTPRADSAQPVRLPGEIEMENLARHRREGIEIDAGLRATLEGFAARRA